MLDNLEQVLPVGPRLAELLAAAPRLRLLATSRAPLRLLAEHEYPVPPLALPSLTHFPDDEVLAGFDAVSLFVERARHVRPAFALEAGNARAVAEICVRLDGLPLAIELAAARLRMLTPRDLLARLQRRLELLTDGPRDLPERQQTLRATIDWSYALLAPPVQALFRQLSVFAGGVSLAAAEGVCDAGFDALDGISKLVESSLMRGIEDDLEQRYTMLETIREYALDRLGESEEEAVRARQRHAQHFLDLADRAGEGLAGRDELQWLERLESEHANLVVALDWAVTHDTERAVQAVGALRLFWEERGRLPEGLRLLEAALAAGPASASRPDALFALAVMRSAGGAYEEAVTAFTGAADAARATGDLPALSRALNGLGIAFRHVGDLGASAVALDEALTLRQRLGDRHGVAILQTSLGNLAQARGDVDEAVRRFADSLELHRETDDDRGVLIALGNLGAALLLGNRLDEAEEVLTESLERGRLRGSIPSIASDVSALGELATRRGDPGTAATRLLEALDLYVGMDDREGLAHTLDRIAALVAPHAPPAALTCLAAAEAMRERAAVTLDRSAAARREDVRRTAAAAAGASEAGRRRAAAGRIPMAELRELVVDAIARFTDAGLVP